ncbi:hypothetical protein FOA52_006939 [Chlamydomonas sp. UWO 241]|nr:hypothetical protein FOA52_006939 [Chlamydomonas sp. UWO 241]
MCCKRVSDPRLRGRRKMAALGQLAPAFFLSLLLASFASAAPSPSPNLELVLPIVEIPIACNLVCEPRTPLYDKLVVSCVRCLMAVGSLNSWKVPDTNVTCVSIGLGGGFSDPAEFSYHCMQQLRDNGQLNTSWAPPPLQRLPFYEAGLTNVAAIGAMQPYRWNPLGPPFNSVLVFTQQLLSQSNWGSQITNVTMCSNLNGTYGCATLPAASTIGVKNAIIPCVAEQGWTSPSPALGPCNSNVLFNETFTMPILLDAPDKLAMMYPSTRERQEWQPAAMQQAMEFFTNVTAAQDSLWMVAQQLYASSIYFKNASSAADVARMQTLYGDAWEDSWTELAAAGDLVEMDFMWLNGMGASPIPIAKGGPATWNIACHVVMQYIGSVEGGNVSLRVVATVLGNARGSTETAAYSPAQSETAFILAMQCVRTAFMQHLIWFGHVYHLHVLQGAASYTMYNTIETELPVGLANHPVRQLLDGFLDPTNLLNFDTALLAGFAPGPPTPVPVFQLAYFYEVYSTSGPIGNATLFSTVPKEIVKRSGLAVERFSTPETADFKYYPLAGDSKQLWSMCRTGAKKTLGYFYPNDARVRDDKPLQAWLQAMLAPRGGNLRQVTEDNTIRTRSQLYDVAAQLMYQSLVHSVSKLQDYIIMALSMAHLNEVMNIEQLFNATAEYSVTELLAATTNTEFFSASYGFICAFLGVESFTALVPSNYIYPDNTGSPDFEAERPFSSTAHPNAAFSANKHLVQFKRDVSKWMAAEHDPLVKPTNTNIGSPMILNYAIDL